MEVIGLKKEKMGFEETELRLGLPGNKGVSPKDAAHAEGGGEAARKRGFSETENNGTDVDLMLNLSSSKDSDHHHSSSDDKTKEKTLLPADPAKPPAKYVLFPFNFLLSFSETYMWERERGRLHTTFIFNLIFSCS